MLVYREQNQYKGNQTPYYYLTYSTENHCTYEEFKSRVLERATAKALEAMGEVAESYTKEETPVDTGRLRNSMSHAVKGHDAYIGTNVYYAP